MDNPANNDKKCAKFLLSTVGWLQNENIQIDQKPRSSVIFTANKGE